MLSLRSSTIFEQPPLRVTTVCMTAAGCSSPGPLETLLGNLMLGCAWTDNPDLVLEAANDGEVLLPLDEFAEKVASEIQVTFYKGGDFDGTPYIYLFINLFTKFGSGGPVRHVGPGVACVALVGCLCFIFVELCLVLHVMFCR